MFSARGLYLSTHTIYYANNIVDFSVAYSSSPEKIMAIITASDGHKFAAAYGVYNV